MSRIVDITDLVDDSSSNDSDSEDGIVGHNSGLGGVGGGGPPSTRTTTASSTCSSSAPRPGEGGGRRQRAPYGSPAGAGVGCRQALILASLVAVIAGSSLAIGYAVVGPLGSATAADGDRPDGSRAYVGSGGGGEQKLLEIAERVVVACSESALDSDMSDCRSLCRDSMCCFEGDGYSCADDETRNCAAYAGCSNLMDGVPLGAAVEGED
jgi:hypothetical protein